MDESVQWWDWELMHSIMLGVIMILFLLLSQHRHHPLSIGTSARRTNEHLMILEIANNSVHDAGPIFVITLCMILSHCCHQHRIMNLQKLLCKEAGEQRGSVEGLYNLGRLLWDKVEFVSAMEFHGAMELDIQMQRILWRHNTSIGN